MSEFLYFSKVICVLCVRVRVRMRTLGTRHMRVKGAHSPRTTAVISADVVYPYYIVLYSIMSYDVVKLRENAELYAFVALDVV